ncbi:hypothetical protein ES703_117957 [subsurface metagenome]
MARILGVDHITFAVRDLERTLSFVEKVLGGKYLFEIRREEGRILAIYQIGDKIIAFATEPIEGKGFMAQFLRQRGEGLHHIALSVDDLDDFKQVMLANGIKIPHWELEGHQGILDEVLIGTRHAPTVLEIIGWKGSPPASTEEWVARYREYVGEELIRDRRDK